MPAPETTQIAAFTVSAPDHLVQLAAPIVAIHLGMSRAEAVAQLHLGRLDMGDGRAAARLLPLLQVLGFSPRSVAPQPDPFAVQVVHPAEATRHAPLLARLLHRSPVSALCALQRPGGIILTDLTAEQVADARQHLRGVAGVRLTRAQGPSDLFAVAPLEAAKGRALSRHLAVMGLTPCRFSGALAAGLSSQQVAQLRTRFDDTGLLALNRAFQRFDLFLIGTNGLPAKDVAAFLSTRADLSGAMVEAVTPLCPLQIERGLTRASAIQFQADYAAIGLETCARLAWH